MYAQVEKPKENKNRVVANGISQKLSGEKTAFQLVDNRTVNVAQRTLQEMVDSRCALSHRSVIQRNIDSTGWNQTNNYCVNPGARKVLYGKTAAAGPVPEGLYARKNEVDDRTGGNVYAWTPNVTFLDMEQKTVEFEGDKMVYTTLNGEEHNLDLEALQAQTAMPAVGKGERAPTIGMLGKNDCAQFAETLYNAIARSGYEQPLEQEELAESIRTMSSDYPEMNVGDMMVHIFKDKGTCPWHGATVVAKDSGGLVTLEAHVSQDLDAPHFHIRDGAGGFVTDNNPEKKVNDGPVRGTELRVTKYQSGPPSDSDLTRYINFDQTFAGTYRLRGGVGTTQVLGLHTEIRQVLTTILTSGAATTFWGKQTLNKYSKTMPGGITDMRNKIGSNFPGAVKVGVEKWRQNKSWKRSKKTNDFYKLVRDYSLAQAEALGVELQKLKLFRDKHTLS